MAVRLSEVAGMGGWPEWWGGTLPIGEVQLCARNWLATLLENSL